MFHLGSLVKSYAYKYSLFIQWAQFFRFSIQYMYLFTLYAHTHVSAQLTPANLKLLCDAKCYAHWWQMEKEWLMWQYCTLCRTDDAAISKLTRKSGITGRLRIIPNLWIIIVICAGKCAVCLLKFSGLRWTVVVSMHSFLTFSRRFTGIPGRIIPNTFQLYRTDDFTLYNICHHIQ